MKKDSIIKMLRTLNSKGTKVNISIIGIISTLEMFISNGIVGGVKKTLLMEALLKDFPKRRISDALQALNKKGITVQTTLKGIDCVNMTPKAWIKLLGVEYGKNAAELISEGEKAIKDISTFVKKEGMNLKKKAFRKLAKGVDYLKDKIDEVSKK